MYIFTLIRCLLIRTALFQCINCYRKMFLLSGIIWSRIHPLMKLRCVCKFLAKHLDKCGSLLKRVLTRINTSKYSMRFTHVVEIILIVVCIFHNFVSMWCLVLSLPNQFWQKKRLSGTCIKGLVKCFGV